MINITSKALEALKNGASQSIKIGVTPLTGEPYEIGGADITLGGLTIERLCVNGDEFEVGSCCASTAKVTLDNSNGKFDGKFFGGAVLYQSGHRIRGYCRVAANGSLYCG